MKVLSSGLMLGSGIGLVLTLANLTTPLRWLDANLESLFFHWRGQRDPHPQIVILAIDDESLRLSNQFTPAELAQHPPLDRMQSWPWPRSVHAAAIERLRQAGAKTIAFDIVFDSPSAFGSADDQRLRQTIQRHASHLVFAVNTSQTQGVEVQSQLLDTLRLPGIRTGLANFDSAANQQIFAIPGQSTLARIPFPDLPPPLSVTIVQAKTPVNDIGIDYRGSGGTYPTYPYWMLFEPTFWQANLHSGEVFRDKVVLIGGTAAILQDIQSTPFDQMPGVEIHANAVATLLDGSGIGHPPLAMGLIGLAGILIGAALDRNGRVLGKVVVTVGLTGIAFLVCYGSFLSRQMLPTSGILGTLVLTGIVDITRLGIREQRSRQRLSRILERRVAPAVLAEILAKPEAFAQKLGGNRTQVAILFSDIRGFTGLGSQLSPEDLVTLLNRYFSCMVTPILAEQGTLDKFIGDAIMAEFGTPRFRDPNQEALAAVTAALKMRERLVELRQHLQQENQPLIFNGIGINFGEVVAGNLGSPEKIEYTVIGDVVNVASRIESMTKVLSCDILISESVYQLVHNKFECIPFGSHILKGKTEPITLYGVVDWLGGSGALYRQVQQEYEAYKRIHQ